MSQMPVTSTVRAPRRPAAPARPDLRVVTAAPRPAPRLPFVLLCSFVLAGGLLALLLLNMGLASGAYALHDLQTRSSVLTDQEEKLREELAVAESPASLSERAAAIGLVPGTDPVYLDVSSGRMAGTPTPAPTPTASDTKTGAGSSASAARRSPRTAPTAGVATPLSETGPSGSTRSPRSSDPAASNRG